MGRGELGYQYTIVDKLFHYRVILLYLQKVLKRCVPLEVTERPWGKLSPQGLLNKPLLITLPIFGDSLQWIS